MKYIRILAICAFSLALTAPLCAQEEASPLAVPPRPPKAPKAPKAPQPILFDDSVHELSAKARALAGEIGNEARAAAEQVRDSVNDLRLKIRNDGRFAGPTHGNRTLVLPTDTTPSESLSESHEDLSVMSRILNKAAERVSRRSNVNRFVFSMGGETGGNLDAMYLEGYGAVFMLSAPFPLAALPQASPPKAPAKEEDATWERTKREVRGQVDPDDEWGFHRGIRFGEDGFDDEKPKFDAEKVEGLKQRLTESLRHAKNLRGLRDGEHVTVIVFGQATGKKTHVRRLYAPDQNAADEDDPKPGKVVTQNIVGYVNTDSVRQTTLVIRAKKSDIARFAADEIKAEEFAKTVSISAF